MVPVRIQLGEWIIFCYSYSGQCSKIMVGNHTHFCELLLFKFSIPKRTFNLQIKRVLIVAFMSFGVRNLFFGKMNYFLIESKFIIVFDCENELFLVFMSIELAPHIVSHCLPNKCLFLIQFPIYSVVSQWKYLRWKCLMVCFASATHESERRREERMLKIQTENKIDEKK